MTVAIGDCRPAHGPRAELRPAVLIRAGIGIALVAAAIYYAQERIVSTVGTDGVITAPVIALKAPIDGRVTTATAALGAPVDGAEPLFVIEDPRADDRLLVELTNRLETVEWSMAGLERRLEDLRALRAELEQRITLHRQASAGRLEQLVRELMAELRSAQAAVGFWQAEAERTRKLEDRGVASVARSEEVRFQAERARSEVSRLEAMLARRKLEQTAVQDGVMIAEGQYDTPYARQRLDELLVRLGELEAERTATANLAAELRRRIAAEDKRLGQLRRQQIANPMPGVVWTVAVAPGTEVTKGTTLAEIVACDRAVVEVPLSENRFDAVRIGDPVRVNLHGAERTVAGTVRSVRGPGAVTGRQGLAAAVEPRASGLMMVVIDLDPAGLAAATGGACQVGRTAKVYFDETDRQRFAWLAEGWRGLLGLGTAIPAHAKSTGTTP